MADRLERHALTGSTGSPPAVGIDVVDLDDPRCPGKASDDRFLARILADDERRWLETRSGVSADEALWALWAAKEAAYKVVTGLEGRAPVFRHATYRATVEELPAPGGSLVPARVRHQGRDIPVRMTRAGRCLVALAWAPGIDAEGGGLPGDLRWKATELEALHRARGVPGLDALMSGHLTPDEARAVHSLPSALVRLGARHEAAEALARDEADVSIVCAEGPAGRVPPRVYVDGLPTGSAAVSLSHHGGWGGWAI